MGPFVSTAMADQQIQAVFNTRYATTSVTMGQGERLTFQNLDISDHDVTATTRGSGGKPLFGTPLIGTGEESFVEGSQYLTTGDYSFVCSIHANMQGTLHVTGAGTPAPRPAAGAPAVTDKMAPTVRLKVSSARASRVRRAGRLIVEVSVNEAAKVGLTATTRTSGRTVTVATGSVELPTSGTRRPELGLARAGRKLLKKHRHLALTVNATAVDSAGNVSKATARRTLAR
jgi:plastocyanin